MFLILIFIFIFDQTDRLTMLVFVSFGAIVNAIERRADNQDT
jgi:hypothetical protein